MSKKIIIRSAARQLVKKALQDGWTIEVLDEENGLQYKGTDPNEINSLVNDLDAMEFVMTKGKESDWVSIIMLNNPDEEVSDYTVGGYIDRWCTLTDYGQKDFEGEV